MRPENLIVLLLTLCLVYSNTGQGQNLTRAEERTGLSIASNNNGIAVADIDQDNDLDIYVVTRQIPNQGNENIDSKLFRNNGDGTFTDITQLSGIQTSYDYSNTTITWDFGLKMGASWGDYDNDGYPDLFLTSRYHLQLYKNNGNGTFTDVTSLAGISESNNCYSSGATWWDYNNDSFLDLYITTWGTECNNYFFENQGDGTFIDKTEDLGLTGQYFHAWMSLPIDVNKDGWMDLYVAYDYTDPNELFINNQGQGFTESASDYGLTNFDRDGMGLAVGDYNNDTKFDILITNIDENSFYTNDGNNVFTDQSVELGVHQTGWAWGVQFTDIDHDLDEDLFIANGFQIETLNTFFSNEHSQGTDEFIDINAISELEEVTESTGMTSFDFDNDGDVEIIVSNVRKPLFLYDNLTIDNALPGQKNWVKFKLEGTTSNRDAIGSIVELDFGTQKLVRYYHGANFTSQSLQPVHFGLDEFISIPSVTITWPSGSVDTYMNIDANNHYLITEGTGIEVLDIQSNKIWGCTDPNSCSFNPEATIDDGSCTYLASGTLNGNTTPQILTPEVYTYTGGAESTYHWEVEGGTIETGQGTNSISVIWDITSSGSLSVIESAICDSYPAVISVLPYLGDEGDFSIARIWNESLLEAIRSDFARPTVHARNLFHHSIALFDAWAVFDESADTYLLGKRLHNYYNDFEGFTSTVPKEEARVMAMSYASYKLLKYRFRNSPGAEESLQRFDDLMDLLGYDTSYDLTYYQLGNPAALGNYIAESIISYGLIDGSRETTDYSNAFYEPVNPALAVELSGRTNIIDPNRWQPLQLRIFIDQSGNILSDNTPEFLSPEWGSVTPFSLKEGQSTSHQRDGKPYKVYMDPGLPPQLDTLNTTLSSQDYQWNFSLVALWSSHLDPSDGVIWDISPAGIGNLDISEFPTTFSEFPDFYNALEGGEGSTGRLINPITNEPYTPQLVPRGDYTRVLAEFWADGPDSETPPGHWFTILNYINDNPLLVKKIAGSGEIVSDLEWDVKSYFVLGGAMHDAAIAAWGIKGWYDYIRPVSAIRYMAERGQSTNPELPNYDPGGIPLINGMIEQIEEGDPLVDQNGGNIGKIKIFGWRGPRYISNPDLDAAGVGWIRAEEWWPYQRPSFVTPPFAGYVSGHSTYSRAAAEVLTSLTGSEYFPGGIGEFVAKEDDFLVFEQGPSQDVVLQWATYRDAADQCSLSRIWGGIHPPADDLPGRLIGERIGKQAYEMASNYFNGKVLSVSKPESIWNLYPNPVNSESIIRIGGTRPDQQFQIITLDGRIHSIRSQRFDDSIGSTQIQLPILKAGMYILTSEGVSMKFIIR